MKFSKFLEGFLIIVVTDSLVGVSRIFAETICHNFRAAHNITYPFARRNESIVDDLHGMQLADPYRWLENPDSNETKHFIEAENQISQSFLRKCDIWNRTLDEFNYFNTYASYSAPTRHGEYYFFHKDSVLYSQRSLNDKPSILLDSTILLECEYYSENGTLLAYCLNDSGSDWVIVKIRNVESGKDFPDLLQYIKFPSIAWTHDNMGFFYNRYDEIGKTDGSDNVLNTNQKLYYHRVGEPQKNDVLVVEFTEYPLWIFMAEVSDCGKYLILFIEREIGENLVYFADLEQNGPINGKIQLMPIISQFEAEYNYVTNTGTQMVFHTNKNAPNYQLIVIDLKNSTEDNWITLVEEHSKDVMSMIECVDNDKLIIEYQHDVKSMLQVHSLETGQLINQFPLEFGNIIKISGDRQHSEIFYELQTFFTPTIIYRYDFSMPQIEPSVFQEVNSKFDKNSFKVEQVFYSSRDGTQIPMFIVQKKSESKRSKPCLLYGYGGFNIAIPSLFNVPFLYFVHAFDGIFAIANIRGGGEYGKKWHDSGRLLNKQNGFDDFHAAAEYLIDNNYTKHKKIAIIGDSNGGLLVATCINQRPNLFGAAIIQSGLLDMLRSHKFTIGYLWNSDYGNPDEKVHFDNRYKFSPIHNVRIPNSIENQYPFILIQTGDHDDRVSPLHSLKFTATLQNAVKDNEFQKNPILLSVYSNIGHFEVEDEIADYLTFLYMALELGEEIV